MDRIRVICDLHPDFATAWYPLAEYTDPLVADPHPLDMEAEMHADLYHDDPAMPDRFMGLMNDVEMG